jgi:hypothetical protein
MLFVANPLPKKACPMSQSSADSAADPHANPAGACFSISAAASPGVMPRVLELFAKRGLTPTDWRSRAEGGRLLIDVRMAGIEPRLAGYIGACMRQIYLVDRVLVTPADAA